MMTNDTTRMNRYESETVLKNTVETLEKGKDYARKLQTRLTSLSGTRPPARRERTPKAASRTTITGLF